MSVMSMEEMAAVSGRPIQDIRARFGANSWFFLMHHGGDGASVQVTGNTSAKTPWGNDPHPQAQASTGAEGPGGEILHAIRGGTFLPLVSYGFDIPRVLQFVSSLEDYAGCRALSIGVQARGRSRGRGKRRSAPSRSLGPRLTCLWHSSR